MIQLTKKWKDDTPLTLVLIFSVMLEKSPLASHSNNKKVLPLVSILIISTKLL